MSARVSQFVSKWRRLIGVLLLAILILAGCSARKRYVVLNTFFDGVPDPDAPKLATGFQSQRGTANEPIFVHKPYAENNCGGCHQNTDNILARARVPADACLKCHANVLNQYPVMHGPVTALACLKCHSPHQSRLRALVKEKTPKLCAQCHTPALLGSMPPEHLDPKSDCLSCHSAHGGSDHAQLKIAAAPTSQPAGSGVQQ